MLTSSTRELKTTLPSKTATTSVVEQDTIPATKAKKPEIDSLHTAISQLQLEVVARKNYTESLADSKQKQEHEILQGKVEEGIHKLEVIKEQINYLATQLESEMVKFTEIAVEVNQDYHVIQQPLNLKVIPVNESRLHNCLPTNIWELHHLATIPTLVKRGSQFVMSAKNVDLFQSEGTVDARRRAKAAQKRREALESWLVEQRSNQD